RVPLTHRSPMSRDITERREWDSNPRRLAPHGFSRAAHLSALPSLRALARVVGVNDRPGGLRAPAHVDLGPQAFDPMAGLAQRRVRFAPDGRAGGSSGRIRAEELHSGQ